MLEKEENDREFIDSLSALSEANYSQDPTRREGWSAKGTLGENTDELVVHWDSVYLPRLCGGDSCPDPPSISRVIGNGEELRSRRTRSRTCHFKSKRASLAILKLHIRRVPDGVLLIQPCSTIVLLPAKSVAAMFNRCAGIPTILEIRMASSHMAECTESCPRIEFLLTQP